MTPGHRLRVIRYAAWYHCSIGVSLGGLLALGIEIPRPWDAMEGFLRYLPVWTTALIYVVAAVLSVTALRVRQRSPWFLAAGVVPQQLLILWAAGWQTASTIQDADARAWLSLMPIGGLAYFHGREIQEVWEFAFSKGFLHALFACIARLRDRL